MYEFNQRFFTIAFVLIMEFFFFDDQIQIGTETSPPLRPSASITCICLDLDPREPYSKRWIFMTWLGYIE